MSDTILFNIFLSQVDWISEKASIIAVMDKSNGVYFIIVSSKILFPSPSPTAKFESKIVFHPLLLTPTEISKFSPLFVIPPLIYNIQVSPHPKLR